MHFGSHVFSCVQSKDGRTEAGGGQDGASSSGAFSPAGSSTAPLVALAAPGPAPRAGPPLVPAPVLQTPVLSALAAASSGRVAALPVEEDKDLQTRIEEKVDKGKGFRLLDLFVFEPAGVADGEVGAGRVGN